MANDVILYRTDDGESAIELHLDNGTVWLTQQELAELFQTSKQNISKHIKAIFEDGELSEEARVWDNSLLSPKKATDLPLLFCMVTIVLVK